MKRTIIILATIVFTMMLTLFAAATSYAACTAITTLPRTISASGNYCLTGNLTTNTTTTAITINSSNVVLDLAGFEIRNTNTGNGIGIWHGGSNVIQNITLKNGRVLGFSSGIAIHKDTSASIATDVLIDSVTIVHSTDNQSNDWRHGVEINANNVVVRNCIVNSTNIGWWSDSIHIFGNNISVINNDVVNPGPDTSAIIILAETDDNVGNSVVVNNRVLSTSGGVGIYIGANNTVVENNSVISTSTQVGLFGIYIGAENTFVVNNRVANMGYGVIFSNVNRGLYRDNMTINCPVSYEAPYSFDAGNNKSM